MRGRMHDCGAGSNRRRRRARRQHIDRVPQPRPAPAQAAGIVGGERDLHPASQLGPLGMAVPCLRQQHHPEMKPRAAEKSVKTSRCRINSGWSAAGAGSIRSGRVALRAARSAQEARMATAEAYRKHGISGLTLYAWQAQFGGVSVSARRTRSPSGRALPRGVRVLRLPRRPLRPPLSPRNCRLTGSSLFGVGSRLSCGRSESESSSQEMAIARQGARPARAWRRARPRQGRCAPREDARWPAKEGGPSLTGAARDALRGSGRDGETAPSRTEKHRTKA